MKEIYTFLMDGSQLIDAHRADLIERRGFGDKVVKKARLFSGGKHNQALEASMLEKFKEQDLLSSSVFVFDDKQRRAVMNPILLRETNVIDGKDVPCVIIPYLDAEGRAYVLRPHKLGLKGVPSEVYHEAALPDDPGEIILTEGEFKAIAADAMGLVAIAVPGIQSFSESKFPQLVDMLKAKKVKKIVIMFDNEVKNDHTIPSRYKEDPSKRYDTEFYSYYMATKLEQFGFETRIGVLPNAWRVDGKIDIDGALKAGKDRGDLMKVMYDALPRNDYLRELEPEAKQMVLRKRAQKRMKGHIKKEFNRYIATRTRGKNSWEEPISNFVIKVVATHDTQEGIKRELEFVNEFAVRSHSFTIDAEAMSSPDKFRKFCLSKGDFSWKGGLDDLMTIWESEFLMMDEGRYIVEADHVGWVESEKVWLFGNVLITGDGKEERPDKDGIIWLEKKGIKTTALSMSTGKSSIEEGVPYLNLMSKVDINEIRAKLAEAIGPEEAAVALGWVSAVPFMEEIFAYCGSFPFLFVTGQTTSGKSTVAEWLMRFFGVDGGGKSISQTTSVAVQRLLAYYSCLPTFLDEYRNSKEIIPKTGFLRNVYNRQSSGKGMKAEFGLREAKVRGTLIVAGEETPKDAALLSRFIPIFISRAKRKVNHFNWFQSHKGKFSAHLYDILKRKKELGPVFAATFKEWQDKFVAQGIEDRLALNYATVVAGHAIIFGTKDMGFADWLVKETAAIQEEQREERAISVFMDDLLALKSRKLIGADYWEADNLKAYVYFHGLHQIWAEQFKKSRGDEAFKEQSIRAYFREEPGFLDSNFLKKVNGQPRRCLVFDLRKCSQAIRILVDRYVDGEDGELFVPEEGPNIGMVHTGREPGEE